MKLLYVCDADSGGISEYAIRQFRALVDCGAEVTCLCRPTFGITRFDRPTVLPHLPPTPLRYRFKIARLFTQIQDARTVAKVTVETAKDGFDAVLFACYREYFSPFWAPILKRAAGKGMCIGTIAHDPIRDFILGPHWWHKLSVQQGYAFASHVFSHDETPIDFGGGKFSSIKKSIIPIGPFEASAATRNRAALRSEYGFREGDRVFLSFGQIRDGKNLDRFLRAIVQLPDSVKLLVTGSGGGASQRSPEYYRTLSKELGIEGRCAWDIRYIPDSEMGNIFAVADYVLLTYSARFRSASAVLPTAVSCRKSVLASSGAGPLQTAVESYELGVFVPPDDDHAILNGAKLLISQSPKADWNGYERDHSWQENARRIIAAF